MHPRGIEVASVLACPFNCRVDSTANFSINVFCSLQLQFDCYVLRVPPLVPYIGKVRTRLIYSPPRPV